MTRHICEAILACTCVAGCASYSAYVPEERTTTTLGGRTAAVYGLPSERSPQGNLRVASHGISEIKRNGRESGKAIHVRMALADTGDHSMTLDARRQRLQLPDGRQLSPAYAASAAATPPVIQVRPGTSRMVDLYFPIPQDLASGEKPPRFDLVWSVWAGEREVSKITPFDKVRVDPAVARQRLAEDIVFEGHPYYWSDPVWGSAVLSPPQWGW